MLVKCPKCRYRFDVKALPGTKELMCVCDRCGQPFAYTVPEGYAGDGVVSPTDAAGAHGAGVAPASSSPVGTGEATDEAYAARPIPDGRPSAEPYPFKPTIRPEAPYPPAGRHRGGRGCLRMGLIAAFILFLLGFLAFSQCHADRSYYGTDMESAYDEPDDF